MTESVICRTRICPIKKHCGTFMAEPSGEEQEYALYLFLVKEDMVYCVYYKGLNNGEKNRQETET